MIYEAYNFAKLAHTGQQRKYTQEPYIVHCAEVAAITASTNYNNPSMIVAAWLHDVVEDTSYTLDDIEKQFGPIVRSYVFWLTEISKPEDGNRAVRKAIDRAHFASAPPDVQTIKYADLISNTKTIAKYDPNFAKVYMREKKDLIEVMNKGDVGLLLRLEEILENYFRKN
jgi:(p)ppGpp synthase/HD superfamily hydrolase